MYTVRAIERRDDYACVHRNSTVTICMKTRNAVRNVDRNIIVLCERYGTYVTACVTGFHANCYGTVTVSLRDRYGLWWFVTVSLRYRYGVVTVRNAARNLQCLALLQPVLTSPPDRETRLTRSIRPDCIRSCTYILKRSHITYIIIRLCRAGVVKINFNKIS